jgi:hypothetical protein
MRSGHCLCGAVAYELEAEPTMLALCHCRDCQRVTGGEPAAVALVPKGSFKISHGTMKAYACQGDSGNRVERNFCPECGSHLLSRLQDGPWEAVKAGTLDEPLAIRPQLEIWTASAQPWAHHPEGVASFEKNPG